MTARMTLVNGKKQDILFTGGLIQIINTVLTIPLSYVILVTQANFPYIRTSI